MTSSQLLISNIKKLMLIRGMNNSQVCKKANELGFSIHPSTFKNVLEGSKCGVDKLDAIASAFNIEPALLLWSAGFNDYGQPIGLGSQVSLSAVSWAVKKVKTHLSYAKIYDRHFEFFTMSSLIKIATEKGIDIAEMEWSKMLAEYQYNSSGKPTHL